MMKSNKILAVLCVLTVFLTTSCATIITGSKSKVTFDSNLSSADELLIDNEKYQNVSFPFEIKVKNGYNDSKVIAKKEGYDNVELYIYKKFNPVFIVNIVAGGIVGMAIDAATGTVKKVESKAYYLTFDE